VDDPYCSHFKFNFEWLLQHARWYIFLLRYLKLLLLINISIITVNVKQIIPAFNVVNMQDASCTTI